MQNFSIANMKLSCYFISHVGKAFKNFCIHSGVVLFLHGNVYLFRIRIHPRLFISTSLWKVCHYTKP
jgi:hypothetical protein